MISEHTSSDTSSTWSHAVTQRLGAMNFLNEAAGRYPKAISFASGRPADTFFDLASWRDGMADFFLHVAGKTGQPVSQVESILAQYGPTSGVIADLVSAQVLADEGIACSEDRIVLTSGAQEGIDLCVRVLCPEPNDVVIAQSPTYIGITGAAYGNRREIVPLRREAGELQVIALTELLRTLRAQGKRARILYLSPDYSYGEMITGSTAMAIVETCSANGVAILDDNPYSAFHYDAEPSPRLSCLPQQDCVIHVGTYSKTICPAVRTGFLILPSQWLGSVRNAESLLNALVQAKSFVTVNSSQITQAMVAGVLLRHNCTLRSLVAPIREHYRHARDEMLAALELEFDSLKAYVEWTRPRAGFFLTLSVGPFSFDGAASLLCAQGYGVIVTPLSFFALNDDDDSRIRLAFSNVPLHLIRPGIQRLAKFVSSRLPIPCLT